MKAFFTIIAAIFALALNVNAQLPKGTGARNPDDLVRQVELFVGCESKVVTFAGANAWTTITKGSGVLVGVEIVSGNESNAPSAPFLLEFWDKASASEVMLASTSLGDANRIIASQLGGPPVQPLTAASIGGTFTTSSLANTRNNSFRIPIKFTNGIVMQNSTAANYSKATVYWMK